MSILWTIIIGFVAGVVAKFIMPGDNEPSGFILTTILGIVGAFIATYLGQSLGWYRPATEPIERVVAFARRRTLRPRGVGLGSSPLFPGSARLGLQLAAPGI